MMNFYVMKKLFLLFVLGAWALVSTLSAQTAQEEIAANRLLSANNYRAYPLPKKQLTPAPEGYEPFYISTYMRHGSRYLTDMKDYQFPRQTLEAAGDAGKLTEQGREVLATVARMADMAEGRIGELTPLGARQHRGIAERMFRNFPQIFADSAVVDARSTVVIRCILSMTAECLQLQAMNPELRIFNDASRYDMTYMNPPASRVIDSLASLPRVADTLRVFIAEHVHPSRLMGVLFNDPVYVKEQVDSVKLMRSLFAVAANMQSHDTDMELFSLFTDRECYDLWRCNNLAWNLTYACSPVTDCYMPYREAPLLRNILDAADKAINQGTPAAHLRFGHESCLLPLAALLELNNCGVPYNDTETLDRYWRAYDIFPMGCNIQFVFYRRADGGDVLVKVLLNEQEATLPLPAVAAPYYRWKDVEAYYRAKLEKEL